MQLGGLTETAALTIELERKAEPKKSSSKSRQQDQTNVEDKQDET